MIGCNKIQLAIVCTSI